MVDAVSLAAALLALLKTLGSKLDSIKTQYKESKANIDILKKKCRVLDSVLHSIQGMSINDQLRKQFETCLHECQDTISRVLEETSKLDPLSGLQSVTFKIWWNGNTMKELVTALTNDQLNLSSLFQANLALPKTHQRESRPALSMGNVFSSDRWSPTTSASASSYSFNRGGHASPKADGMANLKLLIRQEALGNPQEVNLLVETSGLQREHVIQNLEALKIACTPLAYRKVLRALVQNSRDFNRTIGYLEILRNRGTEEDYKICLLYMESQNYAIERVIQELGWLTSSGSNSRDYTIALEYLQAKQYDYELTMRMIDKISMATGGNPAFFSHMMCEMHDSGFSDSLPNQIHPSL